MALALSRVIDNNIGSSTFIRSPSTRFRWIFVLEIRRFFSYYHSSTQLLVVDDAAEVCDPFRPAYDAEVLYSTLIDKSACRSHLNQIHARFCELGLRGNGFLITKFLNACANVGEVRYARQVFDEFPEPYVFLWNAVIRGYAKHNMFDDAVRFYARMRTDGVNPDCFTFPHVLKACGGVSSLCVGRIVHGQIFRYGFCSDNFVQNGLVAMYTKCEEVGRGRVVFEGLSVRTVVSWTSVISGYSQNGQPMEALRLFSLMRLCGDVRPDWIALVSVLKAYTDLEDLNQGKSVHSCVIKLGLQNEQDLVVTLTGLYARSGQLMTARFLFDQVEHPNLLLWNAMISGYAKNESPEKALELFRVMIDKNISTDSITVRSAILAQAHVGSLKEAKWMDEFICNSEYKDDVFVNTALIDMYSKCGSVESARATFDRTIQKDVVVWSAMIVGYALHGQGQQALDLFSMMKRSGVSPNDATFVGLLMACNHSGLAPQGWELFQSMKQYGIQPRHQHYACVVDILARAGYLNKAYEFVKEMPIEPGVSIWGALLSACKIHRNIELGAFAAEKLFALDPLNTGHYVQLSNLYASVHSWDQVARLRVLMKEKGLTKDSGHSFIEINGKLEAFRAGDRSHPKFQQILEAEKELERRLKVAGFIPHRESVLHDLNNEEVEESLCNHSERIAIAYGLISTPSGTTLRITKNLRACVNCHSATKLISKLVGREIVVRDAKRFHKFKDGACSCGDYW